MRLFREIENLQDYQMDLPFVDKKHIHNTGKHQI